MSTKLAARFALLGSLFALFLTAAAPARASEVGLLTCKSPQTTSYILWSSTAYDCWFQSAVGGGSQHYTAVINRAGAEIGWSGNMTLVWACSRPAAKSVKARWKAAMSAPRPAPRVGVGVRANALVGGLPNSFTLQPVSVEGEGRSQCARDGDGALAAVGRARPQEEAPQEVRRAPQSIRYRPARNSRAVSLLPHAWTANARPAKPLAMADVQIAEPAPGCAPGGADRHRRSAGGAGGRHSHRRSRGARSQLARAVAARNALGMRRRHQGRRLRLRHRAGRPQACRAPAARPSSSPISRKPRMRAARRRRRRSMC